MFMKKITLLILILIISNLEAQNIVFTINTATASGSTITETVIDDGKTYVFTAINNSGSNADLLNFNNRLQFRALANTSVSASWTISITEDGTPFTFTFGSVDYLTLGSGTYNITDGGGNSIVNSTNLFMGGSTGTLSPDNINNSIDVSSVIINSTFSATDGPLTDVAFYNFEINPVSLSLNENKVKNVTIYPNPVKDKLFIESLNNEEKKLYIYDLNGRVVKKVKTNREISVSDLKPGIYLLKIDTNQDFYYEKIIIQ